MNEGLMVTTLGNLAFQIGEEKVKGFTSRKAEALLVYLAVEKNTTHRRERLFTLLWPELPESSARNNLRVVLSSLRQAIPEVASIQGEDEFVQLLMANRQTAQINPAAAVEVDIHQIDHLLDAVDGHDHLNLGGCEVCVDTLEKVVALYRGNFLADFYLEDSTEFEDWAEANREAYRGKALQTLERLAEIFIQKGVYDQASKYAYEQVKIDPLREIAYRQLMALYSKSGQRTEALRTYQRCEKILDIELGTIPSRETTALYEIISGEDLRETQAIPREGMIRGYQIREHLGSGHTGMVFRAFQPVINRDVAVKVIAPQFANHPDFIRRFEVEAQLVARLEHPYIVPLYDYWRDPSGAYLVMRWLKGGSLKDDLKNEPWMPDAAVGLMDQISAALSFAHRQGVVHCDIKPANIMLDDEKMAYLTDFGIAKLIGPLAQWSQYADMGTDDSSSGSLGYLSPEMARGRETTPLADVYSLGVVLFELLTARHPFPGLEGEALIQKHLTEPLPSVQALRAELPAGVDEVIQKATEKDPGQRYPNVNQLAQAFRAVVNPETITVAEETEIRNPYKGLRSFEEADSGDFFGRDQLVGRLLERLSPKDDVTPGERFIAVVGPSGSGKSSVVKAGLVPAVRRGEIPGSEDWFIVEMTPGAHPLDELESGLLQIAIETPEDFLSQLKSGGSSLLRVLRKALPVVNKDVLLVIDQLEELFTLVEGEAERKHFLDMLVTAVSDPHSTLRLVVTLRADFYDCPLEHGEFGELIQKATEVVLPLNPEELERAINGPAERVGASLETALVAHIIQEVGNQPGTLPLLQYALTESFELREGNQLSLATYEAGGGLLGALGHRAEEIYQNLDGNQHEMTRQMFLRLVTLGEGTEDMRRRVLLSEIEAVYGQSSDGFRPVTDQYVRYRLLTFDHDPSTRAPTVELAHEALLREWPRLRGWMDESRDDIRMQRLLASAALEWEANGHETSYLLRGSRLEQFDQWVQESDIALSVDEQTYLDASLAARRERQAAETERQAHETRLEQRSRRFLRALVGVFALATVIAVVLSVLAFNQSSIAQENAATATYAQGEALSFAAAEATSAADAREQQAIAEEQQGIAEEQSEARATQQAIAEAEVIARSTAQAEAEIAKEEAQRQASVGLANAALLELESGPQDRAINLALEALENYPYTYQAEQALSQAVMQSRLRSVFYHTNTVGSVQWSPDGKRLLTASDDGTAKIWEPSSGKELLSINHDDRVNFALWSDDGTQVLTVERGSWDIILWDSDTGEKIVVMEGHTEFVNCAYWSPDGSRVLSASDDMTARIWDTKTGELLRSLEHPGGVQKAQWSPSGETFVTVGDDAPTIWDASTGEQIITLKGHTAYIWDGQWSPEGDRLLTRANDHTTKIWDPRNGKLLLDIQFSSKVVSRLSPDGMKILVRDADYPGPSIYNATTGEKLLDLDPGYSDALPTEVVWSPSGDRVATGFWDGNVVVWDSSDGDILLMLRGHSSQVFRTGLVDNLHWSPDGRWLASGSRDGSVMVWDTQPDFTISNLPGLSNARWSPTGDRILQANSHTGANIYDSTFGNLLLNVETEVMGLPFGDYWSPLGDKFGLGFRNGEVRIYDASDGAEILRIVLPGNAEFLDRFTVTWTYFGWSPGVQRIATGHDYDGSIRIWNALSGEELLVLRDEIENFNKDGYWFSEVRWSPLGDKILTADTLQHLIVWDAHTGEKLLHIKDFENDEIWKAAWSPDGTRIATHTRNNIGNIWDAVSGEKLLQFSGHTGEVWGLFWSPTGVRLATGGYDKTVRVWDTSSGDQVLLYPFDRKVNHVDWSPDGGTLLISNADRILVFPVWNSTQELIDYARECCLVRELTPEEREFFGLSPNE